VIKINLVPVKEKKKRQEFLIILGGMAGLVLVVLVLVYIYLLKVGVANDLTKQIEDVRKESESYQDKINEVKDLEGKEGNLTVVKKTIQSISETQRKVLVAVDQIALNMPNGVWISAITQGMGNDSNKFTVKGFSFTDQGYRDFWRNFQKSIGFVKEVTFDEDNPLAAVGANKRIRQFTIVFKVVDQNQ
jgi:Tfp pilus assembly protein PilN